MPRSGSQPVGRRAFLSGSAVVAAATLVPAGRLRMAASAAEPAIPGPPFTLGVASGDPAPTGVVLWTRLAPDPLNGGGMPAGDITVGWEVASDPSFGSVVASGTQVSTAALAHSVHVEVTGLQPDTAYWYRFHAGGFDSPAGRTRTLPAADSHPGICRFAFSSCQLYSSGYYTAYAALAGEAVDLVLFLGDYIYEAGGNGPVRDHIGGEVFTLDEYRNRYAQYKTDADLQAAHSAFPWVVVWDDHEVENNYAGAVPQNPADTPGFLPRRAAAYQAWWEHQPVRGAPPSGPDLRIYRSFDWGDLARFAALDGRQYRSDQGCGDGFGPPCADLDDPSRTMLGTDQEAWLASVLTGSPALWNVVAQQTVAAPMDILGSVNFDQWDGYPFAQQRLFDLLGRPDVTNPLVLTGDIHSSWITELPTLASDRTTPTIGLELVAPSISSRFTPSLAAAWEYAVNAMPGTHHASTSEHGYTIVELRREALTAENRVVSTIDLHEATVSTSVSFVWPATPQPPPATTTTSGPSPTSATTTPVATPGTPVDAAPTFTG